MINQIIKQSESSLDQTFKVPEKVFLQKRKEKENKHLQQLLEDSK